MVPASRAAIAAPCRVLAKAGSGWFRGAALSVALVACGGEPEAQAPVTREGPEDQILRIGKVWISRQSEKGFRTPPSPVATFESTITSTLSLQKGPSTAGETITVEDTFRMQSRLVITCHTEVTVTCAVAFGDHAGESAVEVSRPAIHAARRCDAPGAPSFDLAAAKARFALRADRLVAFAPVTEQREYLPSD